MHMQNFCSGFWGLPCFKIAKYNWLQVLRIYFYFEFDSMLFLRMVIYATHINGVFLE